MSLPVLSADGTLDFPDPESLVSTYERLRDAGQFEAQVQGIPASGIVRLRIRLPDSKVPLAHTAALRPSGSGRAVVGMGGAATVVERLERAVQALRCPAAAATPAGAPARPSRAAPAPRRADPPAPPRSPSRPVTPAPPPPTTPPIEMRGAIVRQPHIKDLRALFSGLIDRSALAATHLADVLRFLGQSRATGRLRLVGPRTKTFWIVQGDLGPSEADPPRQEEYIGHLAIKMGRLTSAAPVEEAVALARKQGRRTGEILVEKGLLNARQLVTLLRAQTEARLLEASEWSTAQYEFVPGAAPSDAPLLGGMRARVALARHVAARATPQEMQSRFEAIQKQYGRLRPLCDVEETALLGDARTGHTLRHAFPGTHRLHDALLGCPLGRVPTTRLLLLLDAYGALELDAAPLVLARGSDPAGALRHRALQARGHDPFWRLGAHPAMHVDQIRESYARTMNDYGPGGPWDRVSPEAAAAMIALVEEAFRGLYDAESRGRRRREALGEDRSRFVAELLCAQGHALLDRGQGQHVRPLAEVALELCDLPDARELLAAG
jgi:uncharacterized protein DUF4388